MQQVCQFVTLQDLTLQNIEICFTQMRICHWKFEGDTLCAFSPWGVNIEGCYYVNIGVWAYEPRILHP